MNKIISLKEQFDLFMKKLEENGEGFISLTLKNSIKEDMSQEKKDQLYKKIMKHFSQYLKY